MPRPGWPGKDLANGAGDEVYFWKAAGKRGGPRGRRGRPCKAAAGDSELLNPAPPWNMQIEGVPRWHPLS